MTAEKRRHVGNGADGGKMIGGGVLLYGMRRDRLGGEDHTDALFHSHAVEALAHHGGKSACVALRDVGSADL